MMSFFLHPCEQTCKLASLIGLIVRRQRIPLPDPVKYRYYDILDLNIGKECEFFGRTYKITDCDPFTRKFLNRMGIPVPDPIEVPCDPLSERQKRERVCLLLYKSSHLIF